MSNRIKPEHSAKIEQFYVEAYKRFTRKTPLEVDVSFYPYVATFYKIKIRDGKIIVRLADAHTDMPLHVHKALAYILVAKAKKKPIPQSALDVYSRYKITANVSEKLEKNKRERGRKVITGSAGNTYDLEQIFTRINRDYFRDKTIKPELTWSARKTYRRLGHYDPTHHTIVISKSLDDPSVPDYVVDYLVFHEMLHIHHPVQNRNGRRYFHTSAFKQDERKFRFFEKADMWIEENIGMLKKRAKDSPRPW